MQKLFKMTATEKNNIAEYKKKIKHFKTPGMIKINDDFSTMLLHNEECVDLIKRNKFSSVVRFGNDRIMEIWNEYLKRVPVE